MAAGQPDERIVIRNDQGGYETPPVANDDHIFKIRDELDPVFNGLRGHIFSAGGDNDVFFSIGNPQETIRIEETDVSCMKPTFSKCLCRLTLHPIVTLHDV